MIKRNELAYGNWVTEGHSFPMYIVTIIDNEVYLDFDGNEGDIWEVDYEDLFPIRITDDLLLKIKFNKTPDKFLEDYIYTLNEDNNPYIIELYPNLEYDEWSISITDGENNIILIANIKYIHQLQNAIYFATGKELEIKL